MFMFSCLYNYSGSESINTFSRDRRGRSQGSFAPMLSKQKETKDRTASFSFVSSVSSFPLFPPTSPSSPSCPPIPGILIHPHLSSRVEEEVRAPLSPSPRKRIQRSVWRPSPSRRHRCHFPRSPCPPSSHTPPARGSTALTFNDFY